MQDARSPGPGAVFRSKSTYVETNRSSFPSRSVRLDGEFLCVNAAKLVWRVQASFLGFINEVGDVLSLRFRRMLLALCVCVRETSVRTKKHAGSKMPAFR